MEMTDAVRELRQRLNDTQQAFASRTGLAISTVVRYEHNRTPSPKVLAMFRELAGENDFNDLWEYFDGALREELGEVSLLSMKEAERAIGLCQNQLKRIGADKTLTFEEARRIALTLDKKLEKARQLLARTNPASRSTDLLGSGDE